MRDKVTFAVSTSVKDEERYLEEWLAFNRAMGVERFYLYDNGSTDRTSAIIKAQKDCVYHFWPGQSKQLASYRNTCEKYKDECDWCAFIDVDEFLFIDIGCPLEWKTHHWALNELVKEYPLASCFLAHWIFYGSSGLKKYDKRPVTERFTRRSAGFDRHVKCIVKLKDFVDTQDPHRFFVAGETMDAAYPINSQAPLLDPPEHPIFRINHYVTRSEEECVIKCNKGRVDANFPREFKTFYPAHNCNDVDDPILNGTWGYKG